MFKKTYTIEELRKVKSLMKRRINKQIKQITDRTSTRYIILKELENRLTGIELFFEELEKE